MSVLNAIKDKISDVQYDFKKSIQSLRKQPKEFKRHYKTEGIDLNAGADLLHRSQKQWAELSNRAVANAKTAEETAVLIGSLYQDIHRNWQQLTELTNMISGLPQILENVNKANTQIDDIEKHMKSIENDLLDLEDYCDRCEVTNNKLDHQYQLSLYKQRKNVQLEEVKVDLARNHAKNVEGYEQKMKELMKERQKAFEEVFQEEMQYYKQYGRPQRESSVSSANAVDISEIAVEDDSSALDDFLKSDDFTTSAKDIPSSSPAAATNDEDADDEDEAEDANSLKVLITPDDEDVS